MQKLSSTRCCRSRWEADAGISQLLLCACRQVRRSIGRRVVVTPDESPAAKRRPPLRIAARWLATIALLLVIFVCAVYWASRPQRLSGFIVGRIADALGLEITATGTSEYRLRGTPRLVLRDVVARRHGDAPLLRADRVDIALPWSTVRARGADLSFQRVELDRPQLDLPALQRWLATRPPSKQRTPTLTDGLRIRDGSIVNDDWRIDGIAVDLPTLRAGHPVRARIRGRYADPPTSIPFDLAVALQRPDNDAGLGVVGTVTIERSDWRMPARVALSGPLHVGEDDLRITPARVGIAARFRSGGTDLPFALGLHGPLQFDEAIWSLAPAGVALRGEGAIPDLDARGALALGRRLVLQLQGRLLAWPDAWPALPPPIGTSSAPLPFALDYVGHPALDDVAALHLARDTAVFDGRFRLPDVLAWLDVPQGSPIPPLQGRVTAATMEISGAKLEGIDVRIDDAETAAP
jgi:hypothetical protein